ncbi:MAG: hypothetical protein ACRBI6_14210 [Acidimicrobiales bacterium]
MSEPIDASATGASVLGVATPSDLQFTCPRCGNEVTERLFGPCGTCRADLRATQGNEQTDLEAAEYEPKMNVVPNAIASKE